MTIDEILRKHACAKPHAIAYRFLEDGEEKERAITYNELDRSAQNIALQLVQKKRSEQPLALLLFPSGLDFIAAFFGCLYADVIAVPMPIPKKPRNAERLAAILHDPALSFILTDEKSFCELQRLPIFQTINKQIDWILTDAISDASQDRLDFSYSKQQPVAFLQYTSGSTSAPKGVMVSHENILSNEAMIQEAFGHDEHTIFVGWLPLFHDMGLIGNVLQPMYLGIPATLMSPVSFLQNPLRWLKAVSKYKATTSGAPNFAYQLCCERIQQNQMLDIDLSCWKVAFNGSEPIHPATLESFATCFKQWGFNESAFYPCYGMAEATVFVTGAPHTERYKRINLDKESIETKNYALISKSSDYSLVNLGKCWKSSTMICVNPETLQICKEYEIGEIWLQGSHIALGYWNQPEVTKEVFHAHHERGNFLRTGDLGFLDDEGNLFITGRLKDLIIIRGRNFYPQDIELLIEKNLVVVASHGCAAFSCIVEAEERLVIVAEIKREELRYLNAAEAKQQIRKLISQEFQISVYSIIFIKPASLPKTSSGKIQRQKCKALFLENAFESIVPYLEKNAHIVARDSIHKQLQDKIREILNFSFEEIEARVSLASYGMDSMGAIMLQTLLKEKWNVDINFEDLLYEVSIEDLVLLILQTKENVKIQHAKESKDSYPLSFQQKGVWTELCMHEAHYGYNLAKAIEIHSPIDVQNLRHALLLLIERHELLRASFSKRGPHFKVQNSNSLPFIEKHIDEENLITFFEKESLKVFNLEKEPLFRLWLLHVEVDKKVLFIVAHHLIADLWSLGIFLEELFILYHSPNSSLPAHASYTNYIDWQQKELNKEKTAHALDYWHQCLLTLPIIHSQKNQWKGSHFHFVLSEKLSLAIKKCALANHTTPFVILLSAYALLISRLENSSHVSIGTTFHGRTDPMWHSTFGMFANQIPISAQFSPSLSFNAYVQCIKKKIQESFGLFQLPFFYVREELVTPATSLFRHGFVFQKTPSLSQDFQDLAIPTSQSKIFKRESLSLRSLSWQPPISPMDMSLFMNEYNEQFFGYFEYNLSVYAEEEIQNLHADFIHLLENHLETPHTKIGALCWGGEPRILKTAIPSKTLIEKFKESVEANRDKCALVHGSEHITFEVLESASNQLARHLIRQGVTPDTLVALMLPHSKEVILTLLAVLKIGATFLPIYPKTPLNRLEVILKNSECQFILSEDPLPIGSVQSLTFSGYQHESELPFSELGSSDSIAYIMYTSGSTGIPKGVAVAQYSLLNYLFSIKECYELKGDLHFPLYSSLAFDLTLTSVFFPLLFGHTLHIYPEEKGIDKTLAEIFNHRLMTHVKLTPSHLKLLEDVEISSSNISQLIVGGEQLPVALVEKIVKHHNQSITIVNEYGPTEATIGCIFFVYPNQIPEEKKAILPIGTPLKGTWAYLLNEHFDPVPESISSSLFLGGIDLAYGYWNQASLTAEKFLPDPFLNGERIYRTGDLAIKRGAVFSCQGRDDRQVKVRGFRLELDEIEGCIQRFAGVNQCVVVLDSILCAYVNLHPHSIFDETAMRSFLSAHLPYYMIPAVFIHCKSLPLTPNGKIDFKALPQIEENNLYTLSIKPPKNEMESKLISLWSAVLLIDAEAISTTHSFFELGGDSIRAIQMVARAKQVGLYFTIEELFQHLTVEQLAMHITAQSGLNKLISVNQVDRLPLTPIQEWFFRNFSTNHYNQAVLLSSANGFNIEHLQKAFNILVEHHTALRSLFPDEKKTFFSSAHKVFTIEEFDLQECIHEKMDFLQKSLNIHEGPIIRLGLFSTASESVLGIVIHHLVIDGVSWRILLANLDHLLQQLKTKLPPQLFEQTDLYQEWVMACSQQQTYPQVTQSFKIKDQRTHSFLLDQNITELLLFKIHHPYQTKIQDILLTAFYMAFSEVLNESEMVLHLEGHGRRGSLDLSTTVGWMTSLIPLLLKVPSSLRDSELIKTIKEMSKCPQQKVHPTILFNYLGQLSSKEYTNFTYAPYLQNLVNSESNTPYAIELVTWIDDQQLHTHLIFDGFLYPEEVSKLFAQRYQESILRLVQHCLENRAIEYTPSDFEIEFTSWHDWYSLVKQIEFYHPEGMNSVQKIYPTSSLQEGLIFHTLIDQSAHYIEQAVLQISETIHTEYVQQALEYLMNTHEILRMTFYYERLPSPMAVVHKKTIIPFVETVINLETFLRTDRNRGFSLSTEPLLRVSVVRDGDKAYLIWTFHHLILDGWSLTLLFKDFLSVLKHFYQKQSLPQRAPLSLKPYFNWQKSRDGNAASIYWEQLLQNAFSTPLPKQKKSQHRNGQRTRFKLLLENTLIDKLSQLSQNFNLTLNSLFQAVWSFLLCHHTDQTDILYGTILSGRSPEIDQIDAMVGLFIQTIPVKVSINFSQTLIDIASALQSQFISSEREGWLSLSKIQQLCPIKHHLFDHLFIFENYPFAGQAQELVEAMQLPFKIESAELIEETHYSFVMSILPASEWQIEIQYDPSLYSDEWIESIGETFQYLLHCFTKNPKLELKEIPMTSHEELKCLISLNETERTFTHPPTLIELFEEQVRKTPDRIALIFQESQLTYHTLSAKADQLAYHLAHFGIGPEKGVAIHLEKSLDLIVAWLAVLKTGGFYIPLDPHFSIERKQMICEESRPDCLLTLSNDLTLVSSLNIRMIAVDQVQNGPPLPLERGDPLNLAYVLYTSGSTGKPKGIAMTHQAVCNHAMWTIQHFGLNSEDRMLHLTSFSFDVAVCELHILLVGGTLIIPSVSVTRNVYELLSLIEMQRVSFLQFVPSLLDVLLKTALLDKLTTVRQVLCGADVLKKEDLESWKNLCSIPLTNLYGLTEACIDSTYFDCMAQESYDDIPIGKPIANTDAYILNRNLDYVPRNMLGELFIGGEGLARGYFMQSALTAERFIPHPLKKGKRLFQTRDKAFIEKAGNIHYKGRIDSQVKLRGYRIELGEIESTIQRYDEQGPIFNPLAKILDENSNPSLCAYFTAKNEVNLYQLRVFLEQQLPFYMVPTYLLQLDSFPLNSSGKIDIQQFPKPSLQTTFSHINARSEIEKKIESLWQKVLQVDDPISIDINFFDLGGNSLSLMQVHYQLSELMNQEIPMQEMFKYSTIRTLGDFLSKKRGEATFDINPLAERIEKQKHRRRAWQK